MERSSSNPDYVTVPPPVSVPPVIIETVLPQPSPPSSLPPPPPIDGSTEWTPPTGPESVKLFVGQVPKHFEEEDLRPYLEQYGQIGELLILRHKATRQHKGCAFVTYLSRESAELAQRELHDKVMLPSMSRPLQVNAAGTKQEELRKVFVGMLSKTIDETHVRSMFERFGHIEELTVLKDKDGYSRGCAFIKFSTRQEAQAAINEMHGSEIMPGASNPLVVKYADTERERHARKMQKAMQQFAELSLNPVFQVLPHPQFFNPLMYAQLMQQQSPLLSGAAPTLSPGGLYSPAPHTLLSPSSPTHVPSPIGSSHAGATGTGTTAIGSPGGLHHGLAPGGMGGPHTTGLSHNGLHGASSEHIHSPLQSPLHGFSGYGLPYSFANPSTFGVPSPTPPPPLPSSQKEGPEGCNLFIYHLPQDYGDQELVNLFGQYGHIVSAKVYVDKNTQQSKCFGFVSYDNPQSASAAIYALNGLEIGHKRLKVEHKKPKERKHQNY